MSSDSGTSSGTEDFPGDCVGTIEQQLCRFALCGDAAACEHLLSSETVFDINWQRPSDKNSALHLAAERDHVSVVQVLIRAGANPDLLNDFGLRPIALTSLEDDTHGVLDSVSSRPPRRDTIKVNAFG
uniref:Uncharacterized protein n=1 Tax=Noctiluca scintillans TaxID=2966 RepID=A0A7S1AJ43_NOCSC